MAPKVDPSKVLMPALVVLLISAAFVIGSLWTKVQYLEKGGTKVAGAEAGGQAAPNDPYTPVPVSKLNLPEVSDKDHIKGDKNAKLTWIEYSDLQCPFCKQIHPNLLQMMKDYSGKVRWVYRHYPLDQIHPDARPGANAAECVFTEKGEDAFWQFVDKIFDDQTRLKDLAKIAQDVGVNSSSFKSCFDAKKYDSKVSEEQDGGTKAGVTGTPGNLLLDGKGNAYIIPGAVPYATIKQIIDKALAN